jgi:hypothetical protein
MAARFGALALFGLAALPLMVTWGSIGTLVIGVVLTILHVHLLKWRQEQKGEHHLEGYFLSLEAAIPLVVLSVGLVLGTYLQAFFITGLLVAALVDTFIHLDRLPHMILLSGLALLLPIGVSIARLLTVSSWIP